MFIPNFYTNRVAQICIYLVISDCYYNMPDVACNDPSRLVQNANGQCVDKTLNNTVIGVWNNAIAMQNGIVREPAALQYFK